MDVRLAMTVAPQEATFGKDSDGAAGIRNSLALVAITHEEWENT